MITADQLAKSFQCSITRASKWAGCINAAMEKFGIDRPLRMAHFIAQIGHESGRLLYTCEIASGSNYESRADLGNTQAGDGKKYKGRGLIQVTGRTNYGLCGDALGLNLIDAPGMLELPQYAASSSAWFWSTHKLNDLADLDLLTRITRRINGGINGIDDRRALLVATKEALGI